MKGSKGVRFLGWFLLLGGIIFTPLFIANYCIGPGFNIYGMALTIVVLCAILCGIGLLKLNNYARIFCLWLIWLTGVDLLITFLGLATAYSKGIGNIFEGFFSWLVTFGWFAILITRFLLHPNVKKQFSKL